MLSSTFFSVAAFIGTAIATLVTLKRRKSRTFVTTARSHSSSSVPPTKEHVLALRKKHFSKSVSVSYDNTGPLMIVRVSHFHVWALLRSKSFSNFRLLERAKVPD